MTLTIDEDAGGAGAAVAYECAVTAVQEGPTRDTVTSQTACPDGSITDVGPDTWTLTIAYNTSYLPGSLHRLLLDNSGATATVVWEPDPVNEPGTLRNYEVTLVPGAADYTVGAYANASVELPVHGTPTTTDVP
jgi:hypothetical protein